MAFLVLAEYDAIKSEKNIVTDYVKGFIPIHMVRNLSPEFRLNFDLVFSSQELIELK